MEASVTPGTEPNDQERYAFGRGGDEAKRLASQHADLLAFTGGLIQKQIPQLKLKNVADIAAGTGIWLQDVSHMLNNPANRYYGFDISASQFDPKDPRNKSITFTEHDCILPFPEQYRGMFDLVNVRLIHQALEEKNIRQVVSNLIQLLRPGGYIQWQDVAYGTTKSIPANKSLDAIDDIIKNHMRFRGLCLDFPRKVESYLIDQGLRDVVFLDYDTPRDQGAGIMRDCRFFMLPTTLRTEATALGQTPDPVKIQDRWHELTTAADDALASGYYWHLNFPVIVARKP